MKRRVFCAYCGEELKLGALFLRELEAKGVERRYAPMKYVRGRTARHGKPVPICDACRNGIGETARPLAEESEGGGVTESWQVVYALLLFLLGAAVFTAIEVLYHRVG